MNRLILLVFGCLLGVTISAQIVRTSTKDSLCGRKIVKDNQQRILGWYKPETPGASYDKVIRLASEFMKNTPVEPKTGLPMYLVTCCFQGPHMNKEKDIVAEHWINNPACIYAGSVQSLAIQYRAYSGDDSYLKLVRSMLDYQLENGTTPTDWKWPNIPFASADPLAKIYQGGTQNELDGMVGDGLHVIEPDKIGELGFAYLRFYEITDETKYLDAAIHCADALAKNIISKPSESSPSSTLKPKKSPWPFRVNARNGIVISEYCSNVLEPVKLLRELIRINTVINLSPVKTESYQKAADAAWRWLYSKDGPVTTFIWNGYFEDIPNDPNTENRTQITPVELAKYLIAHPEYDKYIDTNIPSMIHWVANAFKTDGLDAIKEQTWCFEPMGSHTARYGSACALYFERTGDQWYKDQAYRFLNVATYMTYDNGVVVVGPNWPGSWFSDGYGDYIRHFLDAMAAIPEWAPESENHLLRSSSIVKAISYQSEKITYSTFDRKSDEVLRLSYKPKHITVDGTEIQESITSTTEGWTWKPLGKGGVLRIYHANGNKIEIRK